MKIYIRNTTKQVFEINCRLPEMGRIYMLSLHPKTTKEINDLSMEQVERLVAHLDYYGFRNRKEIHGKVDDYHGVLYSLDKPITDSEVLAGYEVVMDKAQDRSVKEASRAALSASTKQVNDTRAKEAEIEMVQENDIPRKDKLRMKIAVDPRTSFNASTQVAV